MSQLKLKYKTAPNQILLKYKTALNHILGVKNSYSFSVYVKFPSIDGIGPDNWL